MKEAGCIVLKWAAGKSPQPRPSTLSPPIQKPRESVQPQGKLELHEKQKQVSEGRGKLSKKICFNYIRQKDDQDRLHTSSTYKMKKKNGIYINIIQFSSVIQCCPNLWDLAACQASQSINNFQSLLKLKSIGSVMLSNNLILCHPLLLLPSIFLRIRVFPMSQFFEFGGQSTGVSASGSVFRVNSQDWFPLG